jgi:peptidoglycan/xylan/chitin deacetylase (PgdA/CDA1 family)
MQERRYRRRRAPKRRKFAGIIILIAVLLMLAVIAAVIWDMNSGGTDDPETTPPTIATSGKLEMRLEGQQEMTLEYGSKFLDPGVLVLYNEEPVEIQVQIDGIVNTAVVGGYELTYTAQYKNRTVSLKRTVNVVDTQAPLITLLDTPGYCPEIGESYQEEGFTAVDGYDGDITDRVETRQEGDVVYYTVTDSSGNTVTVERTIVYGDSIAPVITLAGGDTVTINAGTKFTDPGYTAQDNVDGDITALVTVSGNYDMYQPGEYTYTYTVTDDHGNTATATRTVIVQGVKQPETVKPDGKVIYLTFDDGPSQYTPELLEILAKYNVKATFFVVGNARLEYLDDIVEGGHTIAIHTDTHVYSEIYASVDAYLKDLKAIQQKIYDRTGVMCTLLRFPGGTGNSTSKKHCPGIMTKLTQVVTAMGYQYCDWTVDSRDAVGAKSAEEVYNNVISGIKGKNTAVVLQHDIKGYSVDAVEKIIQWGLANGYTFLQLDKTSPMVHQTPNN